MDERHYLREQCSSSGSACEIETLSNPTYRQQVGRILRWLGVAPQLRAVGSPQDDSNAKETETPRFHYDGRSTPRRVKYRRGQVKQPD